MLKQGGSWPPSDTCGAVSLEQLVPDTRRCPLTRGQCPYGGRVLVLAGTGGTTPSPAFPPLGRRRQQNDEPTSRLREQERGHGLGRFDFARNAVGLGTATAPLVMVEASVQTPGSGGHGPTRLQQNQRA